MTLDSQHDLRRLALRRYHAGELALLEERVMVQEGYAERLREAEYDLLDDYAAGRLDAGERADVERHLLAAADGESSLRLARAMVARRGKVSQLTLAPASTTQAITPERPVRAGRRGWWREPPALRWQAMAAVLVASLVIGYQLGFGPRRSPAPVPSMPAASAPTAGTAGPLMAVPAAVERLIVSLALDQPRGEAGRVVHLASPVRAVRLQVEVDDAAPTATYTVEVRNPAAATHYLARSVMPRTAGPYRFVEVEVPREQFAPGTLEVRVREEQQPDDSAVHEWTLQVEPQH